MSQFKKESEIFLDKMVEMKNALKQQKVNEAIATQHIPFVTQKNAEKQRKIDEAKADLERNIEALRTACQAKIAQYEEETDVAIEAHKAHIIRIVENEHTPKYDNFILEVSKLVDSSGII